MPAPLTQRDASSDDLLRQTAREECYDWYLCALLAPRPIRADLLTIVAFAGELVRIPHVVTEPMMGAIRLQWWRDVLAASPGEATGNPIADAMRNVAQRHALPAVHLVSLVDSQEYALQPEPIVDDDALGVHLNKLWGSLFQLSARVAATGTDARLSPEAAFEAARAYGLARLVCDDARFERHTPHEMPSSRRGDMTGHEGGTTSRRPDVFHVNQHELSMAARAAHGAARQAAGDLPPSLRPALLPLAIVEPYLRASQKGAAPSDLVKAWAVFCSWVRGTT